MPLLRHVNSQNNISERKTYRSGTTRADSHGIYGSLRFLRPNQSSVAGKDFKRYKDQERTYITSTLDDKTALNVESYQANNTSKLSNIFSVNNLILQQSTIEEKTEGEIPRISQSKSFKINK